MTSVLMVVSAADHWTLTDGTLHPTGFWAEELVVPYQTFEKAGWEITVATPGGEPPTVDRLSLGVSGGLPTKIRKVKQALEELQPVLDKPANLSDMNPEDFDLVFYPGGHGPMEDLSVDPVSGALLIRRLSSGKPLALLCHAPAAIFAAADSDGRSVFAHYKMTGLSNREELFNRFAHKAPWLLEDKMKEAGVQYSKGRLPFRPYTVVDRNLYSGQNPQSSKKLAELLVADLS